MASLSNGGAVALAFVGGFLLAVLIFIIGAVAFMSTTDAYGLGHWKLNAKMPLATMWMNLGYWQDEQGEAIVDFQQACASLLKEILSTAQLLPPQRSATSLSVIDLGFGCGDQIVELVRLTQPPHGWNPDTFRYIGLTLNQAQVSTAHRTLARHLASADGQGDLTHRAFQLFCADAARPDSWTSNTAQAVDQLAGRDGEVWLLALDCLYHFRPSRRPILRHVGRQLGGNVMAFDLLLSPGATRLQKLRLQAVAFMMKCPLDTFLTEEQYRRQLAECGYDAEETQLRDVTEHVFAPVSAYIERQERALAQYGVAMGGFKLAGRLFRWFAESGVVRAVIVVARSKSQPRDKEI